jgi:hypothetical protein
MGINMIERNGSDCKYVEIFTTSLAEQAYRAEEQCLLEGEIPNNEKSLGLLGGTRRLTFSKREVQDLSPR